MTASVREAARIIERMPNAEDAAIVARLIESGLNELDAHDCIAFIPLAFARYMLRNSPVKFSPCFLLQENPRRGERLLLSNEPGYMASYTLAEEVFNDPQGRDFMAIAGRSAELQGINSLLQRGSRMEDIALTDVLLSLPLRKTREPMSIWYTIKSLIRSK